MKSTRYPVERVHEKLVPMRTCPTVSASFTARGSLAACSTYSSYAAFFFAYSGSEVSVGSGTTKGLPAPSMAVDLSPVSEPAGSGLGSAGVAADVAAVVAASGFSSCARPDLHQARIAWLRKAMVTHFTARRPIFMVWLRHEGIMETDRASARRPDPAVLSGW